MSGAEEEGMPRTHVSGVQESLSRCLDGGEGFGATYGRP